MQKATGKWPLSGPFLCQPSVYVVMTLHNHHPVGVVMAPTFVPASVPMFAEFGARAEAIMVAALDHDGLSTCNRWCRDSNRAESGNNVSKLSHILLLI